MKRSTILSIGGEDFECVEFYDVDLGCGGVEVFSTTTRRLVGTVLDITVPDSDDPDDPEMEIFEQRIESMLIDEYY